MFRLARGSEANRVILHLRQWRKTHDKAASLRAAIRAGFVPDAQGGDTGFRLFRIPRYCFSRYYANGGHVLLMAKSLGKSDHARIILR